MNDSRYIYSILLLGIVAPIGLIFAVNYYVDPNYQWRFAPAYTIDPMEEMGLMARISKAYQIRYFRPNHIVLGSSRTLLGIDQNYEAWPEGRCYNLAVFGAGIEEPLAYLRHAQGINELDTVVLGLDLFSFNQTRVSLLPLYEDVLSYNDHRFGWQLYRIRRVIAGNALLESWSGFRRGESSPGNGTQPSFRRIASAPKPESFLEAPSQTVEWYFDKDSSRFSFKDTQGRSGFESYQQIVAFCHENDISLKLFISPTHAVELEVLDGFGLWNALELWKRELTRINDATAAQYERTPYPLWDFTGYNSVTSEPVPRDGESRRDTYYFSDPNHYYSIVGDIVLNTLFERVETPGFGVRLSSDSIEQQLAQIREARTDWRETNPHDFERFRNLAREVCPESASIDTEF